MTIKTRLEKLETNSKSSSYCTCSYTFGGEMLCLKEDELPENWYICPECGKQVNPDIKVVLGIDKEAV